MSHLNSYSSIVPSEMSHSELTAMCAELTTARNWGATKVQVHLTSLGLDYQVDVADLKDYQEAHTTYCGGVNISTNS